MAEHRPGGSGIVPGSRWHARRCSPPFRALHSAVAGVGFASLPVVEWPFHGSGEGAVAVPGAGGGSPACPILFLTGGMPAADARGCVRAGDMHPGSYGTSTGSAVINPLPMAG